MVKIHMKDFLKSFVNFIRKVGCLNRLIHLKLLQSIFLYIMMLNILSDRFFGCRYWFEIEVDPLQYKVENFWYFGVVIYISGYEMLTFFNGVIVREFLYSQFNLEWGWIIIVWGGLYFQVYNFFCNSMTYFYLWDSNRWLITSLNVDSGPTQMGVTQWCR